MGAEVKSARRYREVMSGWGTQFGITQYSRKKKHDGLRTKIIARERRAMEQPSWLFSCLGPFCLSMDFNGFLLQVICQIDMI